MDTYYFKSKYEKGTISKGLLTIKRGVVHE